MARKPDPDSTDTEFMKIPALPDDTDLDSLRRIGHFSARDPQGLAAGDYFITNYVSNIGGNRRTIQIAENAQTGAQQYRASATSGWTSWTSRTGGSGSTNLGITTDADSVTITSDTGNDADIPAASTGAAGVMSADDKTTLDALAGVIGNIPNSPARVFNVLDYGALPNGGSAAAATNRAAFEAAIVDAAAAGGGQIYAPRGTYYINYGGAASVGGCTSSLEHAPCRRRYGHHDDQSG